MPLPFFVGKMRVLVGAPLEGRRESCPYDCRTTSRHRLSGRMLPPPASAKPRRGTPHHGTPTPSSAKDVMHFTTAPVSHRRDE